tara:strand:+ start:177 stop:314 length:138 start_codon:yes stop_codon:yes gene_type:complete
MRPETDLPALLRQDAVVANPKSFARGLIVAVPMSLIVWAVIFSAF